MRNLQLCNLAVQYAGETAVPRLAESFLATVADEPCLRIDGICVEKNIHPPADFCLSILAFANKEEGKSRWIWNTYSDAALLTLDSPGHAILSETAGSCNDNLRLNLLLAAFLPQLAQRDGFMMHGALVEHQGEAIIFTASPGMGKSTQAALWHGCFGARILNGDKAFVRRVEGVWNTYGSPWSGSSPYVVNARAPLRGIVVLEQAKENRLRRLCGMELVSYLAPHIYYPSWDDQAVEQTVQTMDALLEDTPVYLLSCLPDRAAAVLTRDAVFG